MRSPALASGLLAGLLSLSSVGCEAPGPGVVAEHELTGDEKADGIAFPSIASRQAVLFSGYSRTRNRRDGKLSETHFALRFALEVGSAAAPRTTPVSLQSPQGEVSARVDAGQPADLGQRGDAGATPEIGRGADAGVSTSAGLPISFRLCDLSITGDHDLSAEPQLYDLLPAATGAVRLYGTTPSAPIHARTAAPIALGIGVALTAPLTEPMPISGTDPRVVDIDEDGNPGVSLHHALGRIFSAVRVVFRLDGTVVPAGAGSVARGASFTGVVNTDQLDVVAFGDTIPFYDAVTSLAEGRVNSQLVEQAFGFQTVAVEAAGCAAVRATMF